MKFVEKFLEYGHLTYGVGSATPDTLVAVITKRQTRREAGAQSLRAATNERQPGCRKGTTHGPFTVSPKHKTKPPPD
jgi:hypothetical protein